MLVVLTVIAEYGAFEILRYQTFTTEIFTEFKFDPPAAGALSLPLVLLGLLVLGRRGLPSPAAAQPRRRRTVSADPTACAAGGRGGPGSWPALPPWSAWASALPVGTLVGWMAQSQHTTLPAAATLGRATVSTIGYGAAGALLATARPCRWPSWRCAGPMPRPRVLERGTYLVQALPGVVIALSLVFFTTRYAYRRSTRPALCWSWSTPSCCSPWPWCA